MAALDHIINSVRSSNFNFAYQETPYSLYLTIRKTEIKNNRQIGSSQSNASPVVIAQHDGEALAKENMLQKSNIRELEEKLNASLDSKNILEMKVATSEAEALKAFKQIKQYKDTVIKKNDEIECLKNVLKNTNSRISNLETEKIESKKSMKKKEQEVNDLKKTNESRQNCIKILKEQEKKFKDEKKNSDNKIKQLETKVKELEVDLKTEINNNRLSSSTSVSSVALPSQYQCSSSIKCLVCGELCSDSTVLKTHSETNHELLIDFDKLTDPSEEDSTSRFINSLIVEPAYLNSRRKCYPEHWDHINERIKVRMIAKMNFADKSEIIDRNMKKMDLSKVYFQGTSFETSDLYQAGLSWGRGST